MLPTDLYTQHRLNEPKPGHYLLTPSERERRRAVLSHAPELAPLPPIEQHNPFILVPLFHQRLATLLSYAPFITGFVLEIEQLAQRITHLMAHTPDASCAALLLTPAPHYTAAHSVQVAAILALARPQLANSHSHFTTLISAALTMNVGAVALQDDLSHQNAPPSSLQHNGLKLHPFLSSALLREAGIDDPVWHRLVLEHHEQANGKGYPLGLSATQQHPLSAILRVGDSLCASLSPRVARSRNTHDSLHTLLTRSATADRPLVECFIQALGFYPPGRFVKLANGVTAIVVRRGLVMDLPCIAIPNAQGNFQEQDADTPALRIVDSSTVTLNARQVTQLAQLWEEKPAKTSAKNSQT